MVPQMPKDQAVKVLLCDDQVIVAEALRRMLVDCEGWSFSHIADPSLLMSTISEFEPTVILQDLVLPDISGIDLLKLVRSQEATVDLPVILLSTTDDAKIKFEAFAAGASDYVVKFPEKFELVGRISYHSRAYCNLKAREKAQTMLEQKSRLESLGNLAAGIAHEINTPLQYISANLSYIKDSILATSNTDNHEEVQSAINETIEGIEQISSIVRAMKAFAHPGQHDKVLCCINTLVHDIELLSKSEWKDFSTFKLNLQPEISPVSCAPGSIAQVLLNLVVNSAQAIKSRYARDGAYGEIIVSTRTKGDCLEIEVEDNGGGIPKNIQEKVFEPFFTTKEIGDGSGQGLALARSIVVEIHKGQLDFTTVEGRGTSFFVRLPLVTNIENKID